jgi:pimeloyl-ACP methyl ester carboxylesterase
MPRTLVSLLLALACSFSLLLAVGTAASATPADAAAFAGTSIRSVYLRPPAVVAPGRPLQVLLALHGLGGNGESFSRDLAEAADHYGWLIVAPTIDYGDWKDPNQVAAEDPRLIRALSDYVDQLPQSNGFLTRRQVLVLGHSRGAQLAHRFAEFRPDKVLAVAALSAGTYTLPLAAAPKGGNLSFPFGVKDLERYGGKAFDRTGFGGVQFWLGVGSEDNNPNDLPRQWDAYEGNTRVQRAQAFETAARQLGASTVLRIFGGTKHDFTAEMRSAACSFLGRATQPRNVFGAPLRAAPVAY